jgi:hypothetical protein
MSPFHAFISCFLNIHLLFSHLRLDLPNGLFPSGLSTKNPLYISLLPRFMTVTNCDCQVLVHELSCDTVQSVCICTQRSDVCMVSFCWLF